VGGVEIGGDILDVPSQIVPQQIVRRRLSAVSIHRRPGADAKRLEGGVLLGRARLPHDDLIVPPRAVRRTGDERDLRVFVTPVLCASLANAHEGEPDGESVPHRHGPTKIQEKGHLSGIAKLEGNRALLDEATIDVRPSDGELALSSPWELSLVVRLDSSIAIEGGRGQDDLPAPRRERYGRQQKAEGHSSPRESFHVSLTAT